MFMEVSFLLVVFVSPKLCKIYLTGLSGSIPRANFDKNRRH